jgi:cell division protein FtsA
MARQNIVVGLDVGTTKVAICVGQLHEGLIHVIGAGLAPNHGMRKGMVVEIEECVSSISAALEEVERVAGLPCEEAYVGVGGAHIQSTLSKGVIAVSRANGEISQADVERVIQAAQAVALPPNREILQVIPRQYIVDGQEGVKDPTGMMAVRLEAEVVVIGGSTSAIRNLNRCVTQSGLQIKEMLFNQLALAKCLLTKKQKELGVLMVDLGGGVTSMGVFEEGDIIYANVLPIGATHLTNDLAIGLRTSIETAEKVKLRYGCALPELVKDTERIDLSKIDPEEGGKIDRRMVVEIIEARLKELMGMIDDELKGIGKSGLLPAGVVLTGGGSLLDGLTEMIKQELHLPCRVGNQTLEIAGLVDKIDSPVYAAAVGLMLTGFDQTPEGKTGYSQTIKIDKFSEITDQIKKIFRHLIP